MQTGRLRVGFRGYDEFYGGSDGIYVDVSERFGFIGVLEKNDIAVVMPLFRWSDIAGTPLNLPLEEPNPAAIGKRACAANISVRWRPG